ITESVLLQADRNVLDALHQFRDLGVRICMDDFGTGYSSLSYLRSFPFDKIKIDRSFIRELGKDNDCMAIIRAIMRLGSSLGMITTGEGVENPRRRRLHAGAGISFQQSNARRRNPAATATLAAADSGSLAVSPPRLAKRRAHVRLHCVAGCSITGAPY